MSGPACNYQNVDLFKIPEVSRYSQRSRSPRNQSNTQSQFENSFATIGQPPFEKTHQEEDVLNEIRPEEILQEAIDEVKVNRQMQQKFGKDLFDKFQATHNTHRAPDKMYLSDTKLRGAQTDIESFFKFPQDLNGPQLKFQLDHPSQFQITESINKSVEMSNRIGGDSFSKISGTYKHQSIEAVKEVGEHQPKAIVHMQFDEAATHQLNSTYTNKFEKVETLERRNPLKYMKNPETVFGTTMGAKQYTWKDKQAKTNCAAREIAKNAVGMVVSMSRRNSPSLKTMSNFLPAVDATSGEGAPLSSHIQSPPTENIKIHNLTRTNFKNTQVLDPVAQLSGKGRAITKPIDSSIVINNVVKPFKASSEVDRQRATQIMDYIINKRNSSTKQKDHLKEFKKQIEHRMLIDQMEQEKAERKQRRELGAGVTEDYSEDTDTCSEGNPMHTRKKLKVVEKPNRPKKVVPEKSLISKVWKLDIQTLEKLDDVDIPPTDGELDFLKEQLTSNKFLKTYMRDWDHKISKILDKEPAIDKLKLRMPMMEKLIENSPTRKAKQIVKEQRDCNQRYETSGTSNDLPQTLNSPIVKRGMTILGTPKSAREEKKKEHTQIKDNFSYMKAEQMKMSKQLNTERRSKIKDYQRFLSCGGVEHLPAEQKKIYKFHRARAELERNRAELTARSRFNDEMQAAFRLSDGARTVKIDQVEQFLETGAHQNESGQIILEQPDLSRDNTELKI